MIMLDDLRAICSKTNTGRLAVFVEPLNDAMREFDIDQNPAREAAFLAQVAHESGGFRYVLELASGESYEDRKDLGNTEPGDGPRFRGRGLIQITGRANYRACGDALGLDLVGEPELLEEPVNACKSAGWFWRSRGLNGLADRGDFRAITKRVNGGYTHYAERVALWERAQGVLA